MSVEYLKCKSKGIEINLNINANWVIVPVLSVRVEKGSANVFSMARGNSNIWLDLSPSHSAVKASDTWSETGQS